MKFASLTIVLLTICCKVVVTTAGNNEPPQTAFTLGKDNPRLDLIRNMTKLAWGAYNRHAFGYDYLKPISKVGSNHHHGQSLGFTVVDALDTLKIMGLETEFQQGRNYIVGMLKATNNFDLNMEISTFETIIRMVGGLVAAYDLSQDKVFLDTAVVLADRLLPAFDTPTGLMENSINLHTGAHKIAPWSNHRATFSSFLLDEEGDVYKDLEVYSKTLAHGVRAEFYGNANDNLQHFVCLADVGSNILEFTRLSQLTGDSKYEKVSRRELDVMDKVVGPKLPIPGLYPIFVSSHDASLLYPENPEYTVGALADSFFEYLLKQWIQSEKTDEQSGRMYDSALSGIKTHLLKINDEGLYYLPSGRLTSLNTEMQHLTCFAGGMVALTVLSGRSKNPAEDTHIAAEITETCYQMYHRQTIGLSPEHVNMRSNNLRSSNPFYGQRPEVIESIFYMWRLTHDIKYRQWSFEIATAIERHTRMDHLGGDGYSGIRNIYHDRHLEFNDLQDSFYLAETLKYLYIIYEDDDFLDLNKWVFSTEAHLFKAQKSTLGVSPQQEL